MDQTDLIRVRIVFLGSVGERAGLPETTLEFCAPVDVVGVLQAVSDRYPEVQKVRKYLFVSVNGVLVSRDQLLSSGDEVALFFRPGGG